jgi:DNA-binding helix-hairpin-helix protein with protein kinase domain
MIVELLRSSNHQPLSLSERNTLGVGGEARIYAMGTGLAAKVYHRPTAEHAAKLAAMLANPPEDPTTGQGHTSIAWPSELLLSRQDDQVLGFLMPLVKGMSPIIDFYHPKTRRREHPLFNYLYLLRTARNLAGCAAALHARGYVIGDLNESNILLADTALVTLVDTDSFQVHDPANGKTYRCRVGKPEFTPPELQAVTFAQQDRLPEHDCFGLAVLLFQLLMEGTHPFAGRHFGPGEPPSLEQRIAAGQFPYARASGPTQLPMRAAPPFETLHPALRELFIRCFVEGHSQPGSRPDAPSWQNTLEQVEGELATCAENEQHRYSAHLTSCPWCERQRLLRGLDPFPSRQAVHLGQHLHHPIHDRPRPAPSHRRLGPTPLAPTPPPPAPPSRWLVPAVIIAGIALVLGLAAYSFWALHMALQHR